MGLPPLDKLNLEMRILLKQTSIQPLRFAALGITMVVNRDYLGRLQVHLLQRFTQGINHAITNGH